MKHHKLATLLTGALVLLGSTSHADIVEQHYSGTMCVMAELVEGSSVAQYGFHDSSRPGIANTATTGGVRRLVCPVLHTRLSLTDADDVTPDEVDVSVDVFDGNPSTSVSFSVSCTVASCFVNSSGLMTSCEVGTDNTINLPTGADTLIINNVEVSSLDQVVLECNLPQAFGTSVSGRSAIIAYEVEQIDD